MKFYQFFAKPFRKGSRSKKLLRTTDDNDGHHTCSLRLGNYQLCVDFHCAGKILKSAYLGKG